MEESHRRAFGSGRLVRVATAEVARTGVVELQQFVRLWTRRYLVRSFPPPLLLFL